MKRVFAALPFLLIVAGCAAPEESTVTVTETVRQTQTIFRTVTPTPTTPPGPKTTFGDGTWIVGTDIEPGTYRAPGGRGCYWERSTGTGEVGSIIDNDNVLGQAVVMISPSDPLFISRGCGTWTQVTA